MRDKRPSGRHGVVAAGTDAQHTVGGLYHVAVAGQKQGMLRVNDGHHRFEPPQGAIGAPLLGQLRRSTGHVRGIVLEFRLKTFQQSEGVGRRAGETGDDLVVHQAADFDGIGLHDRIADGHLTIAAHGDHALVANR